MVFATRRKEHQLGSTGLSLDDFNGVNRDKKYSFKTRFGQVFNKQWTYTQFKNVSTDQTRLCPWKSFLAANIFDPLRQFNPIETYRTVKGNATEDAYQQIDHFF